jgi:Putative Actinobacterial Holin-X, holin superfamily III
VSDTRSAFGFEQSERRETIPDLLRQLTEQGAHLAQQQANLVQAEIRSGITDMKEAAGAMAGAAVVGLAALGVTLMGVAYLLAEAMELWLATLIVGLVTLGAAYAMFAAGKKKLQSGSLSVDRTRRTMERAPSAISGNSDGVSSHGR